MLICLAVDYHAADVATRERYHIADDRLPALYGRLGGTGIDELVALATCNRTELYAWYPDIRSGDVRAATRVLARRWTGGAADARALLSVATTRVGLDAARHVIRVAVGLESQVLGDGQILGQLRAAYRQASNAGATGSVLHRLFETALRSGKRVQAQTTLGSGRNSVGAQAAALAARRFGNLTHTRIVVVGCGKTGERVARQLDKLGARDLVLMNRTRERADHLAHELHGRSAPIDTVHAEVAMADIAIIATGAERAIVNAPMLATARANCATTAYPLLIVDLSMPRNVDAGVGALPGLTLVDLDALRPHVAATEQTRRSAIPAAEMIVDVELQDFADWMAAGEARAAIQPLRAALAAVCRREVTHVAGPDAANAVVERIVSKVLAMPMCALRGAVARGEPVAEMTRAMSTLFSQVPTSGALSGGADD